MNTEIITCCDYAAEQGGKMNVIGTFDTLWANAPTVLPSMGVAFRARVAKDELPRGEVPFVLELGSVQGDEVFKMQGAVLISAEALNPGTDDGVVQFAGVVQNVSMPKNGKYILKVRIADRFDSIASLYLLPAKAVGTALGS
jgi:hypothetical protein